MTYYELLEVSETASNDIIKTAYITLAKKYHPDIFQGDLSYAEEKMKQLNDAYNILSNPESRKKYDDFLHCQRTPYTQSGTYAQSNTYTQSNTYNHTSSSKKPVYKRNTSKIAPFLIIGAIIIFLIFIVIIAREPDPDSDLTPVSEPQSGTMLQGYIGRRNSSITVTASGNSSYVVKLKTASGITRLSFYVRAGDTVTVNVPAENLYVYFASGKTWYGPTELFGKNTSYSMDKNLCDFSKYTWEYTLYPVNNGNFSETPIDANKFK